MKTGTLLGVLGAAAASLAISMAAPARAADLIPLSYTFSQGTDCGSFCYTDSSGLDLVDGQLGYEGWYILPGPWVGWRDASVDIDFDFGADFLFDTIAVGTTQDAVDDVVLPSLTLVSSSNGVDWTQQGAIYTPASTANNRDAYSTQPHGFLTFSGLNFTSRYVRLSAENMGVVANTFIFIDEVDFSGQPAVGGPVPEPSAWLLMLVGFFGLGSMLRVGRRGIAAD